MRRLVRAVTLSPGEASGAPLRLDEPLSFWGGLDPMTGRIIDRWHPQLNANVAGRVLMMPASRGSSSGSAALAEAIRIGVAPAAILLLERDPIRRRRRDGRSGTLRTRMPGCAGEERGLDRTCGGAMAQRLGGAAGREDCHHAGR